MPIPELDDDGYLPQGIHDATMDEIRAEFGRFQKTDQRVRLFEKLEEFLGEVWASGLVASVVVNGSFATGAETPSDVDLVLVLRKQHDFSTQLRPFEYNVLSKRRVRRKYRFDVLVARDESPEYEEYVAFFQQVKEQPDRRKGVLRVLP